MTAYLVTGGTGSMGQALTRALLKLPDTGKVCIYSRGEWAQSQMRERFPDERLRFLIGDVRDRQRLTRALAGIDNVLHTAALKQVPACEFNPIEAVRTNVDGTANVIDAAIDAGVGRVLMLSSDKACDPTNLYGASKLVAEKLIVDANVYARDGFPKFAATRYGNVLWSRGSVLERWTAERDAGMPLTVTDPAMTRFVLTLEEGCEFVLGSLGRMLGGEVFVPDLPAVELGVAATAFAHSAIHVTGVRPGEKQHELLVSAHEAPRTLRTPFGFLVTPLSGGRFDGVPLPDGFECRSDTALRLDAREFRKLAGLRKLTKTGGAE